MLLRAPTDPREYSRPPAYGRPAGPRAVAQALGLDTSHSDAGTTQIVTPRPTPRPA